MSDTIRRRDIVASAIGVVAVAATPDSASAQSAPAPPLEAAQANLREISRELRIFALGLEAEPATTFEAS